YTGGTALPIACAPADLHTACAQLADACRAAGVTTGFVRSVIVCAPRFNELTDTCDSKAAALSHGFVELVRACMDATRAESTSFVIDKHGGRNQYGAMLEAAFPGARVRPCEECME